MSVDSSANLINGALATFDNVYRDAINRQSNGNLAKVMDLDGLTVDNRRKELVYREAPPAMKHWPRGDPIPTEGMASKSFEVVVHNWGHRSEWHEDDREDDQTGTLMTDVAAAGESAGILAEEFFFDMILGSATTLPWLPKAPDGNTIFNSANRFEQSGGNTTGVNDFNSTQNCVDGLFTAIKLLRNNKDGKGKYLWRDNVIDGGIVVICSAEDEKVWQEAFKQRIQLNTAGVSNIFLDTNRNLTLWPTARVATNKAYVFLENIPVKPVFMVNRRGVRERSSLGDMNNSDRTRTTGMEYVQWDLRVGCGGHVPYGCVELT